MSEREGTPSGSGASIEAVTPLDAAAGHALQARGAVASAAQPHRAGRLAQLGLLHFCNDGYSNFLGQLQPVLAERFQLTLAAAGGLASVNAVVSSLSQPFFGTLADRL